MPCFPTSFLQVVKILEKHEPSRSGIGALSFFTGHASGGGGSSGALRLGPIPADEASAVQNYVEHMLFLLMEEEAGQGGRTKKMINYCSVVLGFFFFGIVTVPHCHQGEQWVQSWSLWFWKV